LKELQGKGKIPSSAEEGWMRDQTKCSEATEIRADGVVLIKFHQIRLTNTTPAAPTMWLRTFFLMSRPPLLS
jgi:hypothetical protein